MSATKIWRHSLCSSEDQSGDFQSPSCPSLKTFQSHPQPSSRWPSWGSSPNFVADPALFLPVDPFTSLPYLSCLHFFSSTPDNLIHILLRTPVTTPVRGFYIPYQTSHSQHMILRSRERTSNESSTQYRQDQINA